MSDEMAAIYCDLSLSQFRSLVDAEKMPAGTKIFGTSCVRWLREDLDAAVMGQYYPHDFEMSDTPAVKARRRREIDKAFGIK